MSIAGSDAPVRLFGILRLASPTLHREPNAVYIIGTCRIPQGLGGPGLRGSSISARAVALASGRAHRNSLYMGDRRGVLFWGDEGPHSVGLRTRRNACGPSAIDAAYLYSEWGYDSELQLTLAPLLKTEGVLLFTVVPVCTSIGYFSVFTAFRLLIVLGRLSTRGQTYSSNATIGILRSLKRHGHVAEPRGLAIRPRPWNPWWAVEWKDRARGERWRTGRDAAGVSSIYRPGRSSAIGGNRTSAAGAGTAVLPARTGSSTGPTQRPRSRTPRGPAGPMASRHPSADAHSTGRRT